ncbi:MAG: hypothetical protein NTV93_20855 [Verrucomicrobia bacterium]|nr:hypothetical protein [Verrucomicrobiota bacterium]
MATHAFLVDAVTARLCNEADKNLPAEKRMPVFLSEIAFDGCAWNRHAEHLGENGDSCRGSNAGREASDAGLSILKEFLNRCFRAI